MSDFEDRLNEILGDPARMVMIATMAKSLMGAQEQPQEASAPPPIENTEKMVGRLAKMLGGGGKSSDNKRALLDAMKPYLSHHRREKLERAMKLAKMIGMAEIAFEALGGDDAQI
jgi:hypothetical protein